MAQPNDDIGSHAPAYRRARPQLSCQYCRAGKLKCDRKSPCDACVKRGRDELCAYPAPPVKKSRDASHTRQRIAQLESLVLSLIEQRATEPPAVSQAGSTSSANATNQDHADVSAPVGQLKISSGQTTSYAGDTHWESILASVCGFLSPLTRGLLSRLRI
jgi:Fungal Zn(2)-Cys(6) binuclear cluster domain